MMIQQKEKIRKILKFEKIMKKLCKDVGLDKKTLFSIFIDLPNSNKVLDSTHVKNE
jgi:hypothetical protein